MDDYKLEIIFMNDDLLWHENERDVLVRIYSGNINQIL